MNYSIQPEYKAIKVTCSCGNSFETRSTLVANEYNKKNSSSDLSLDVCSACHPFYTGQQKIVDSAGRVDLFNKRYSTFLNKKK